MSSQNITIPAPVFEIVSEHHHYHEGRFSEGWTIEIRAGETVVFSKTYWEHDNYSWRGEEEAIEQAKTEFGARLVQALA